MLKTAQSGSSTESSSAQETVLASKDAPAVSQLYRLVSSSTGFWCVCWCFVFLALGCYLQENGPIYPLWTRRHLQFEKVDQAIAAASANVYAADLGKEYLKKEPLARLYGLQQVNNLSFLANSKTIGDFAFTVLPKPGEFIFKTRYLMYSPKLGGDPAKDGKVYELYYPQPVAEPIKLASYLGLLFALLASGFALMGKQLAAAVGADSRAAGRANAPEQPSTSANDKASTSANGKASTSILARYGLHAILAALTLLLVIYLSTGSLTPYNLFANCIVRDGVPYFTNSDHGSQLAIFRFLNGEKGFEHEFLRRVLFPFLSFPLMKLYGYAVGGLIGSVILNVLSATLFGLYCRKNYGNAAGILVVWLLSFYPGIAYFAGVPYVNTFVVPGSLAMLVLLVELERSSTTKMVALLSMALGIITLGYDLIVFVGPAAIAVLLSQKRFKQSLIAATAIVAPMAIYLVFLWTFVGHDAVQNGNTSTYTNDLMAYTRLRDPAVLRATILALPSVLETGYKIYFSSTFYFLPAFFALAFVIGRSIMKIKLLRCEFFLLLTALALFLFTNCAPEYYHSGFGAEWQLRGCYISRIYEPIFAVFLFYLARQWAQIGRAPACARALLFVLAGATILGNAVVCFGPILNNPFAISSRVYHDFYMHGPELAMQESLRLFGRKPVGVFNAREALKSCYADGHMKW